tara:strand:- start:1507 stop:2040 length:534 start_codon:yes stop_codon:yes gene_type:complete
MKKGLVFWFSGLSGVGKTTVANIVRQRLETSDFKVSVLDGDDIRNRLHRHLGFSDTDIKENNKLIAGLCESERLHADIILVPIISPYVESRADARKQLSPGFFEIHLFAEISILEERDTKGLYAKARNGEIENLIGYSPNSSYEPPEKPDIVINTGLISINKSCDILMNFILSQVGK